MDPGPQRLGMGHRVCHQEGGSGSRPTSCARIPASKCVYEKVELNRDADAGLIDPEGDTKIERVVGAAQDRAYVQVDLSGQGKLDLGHLPDKIKLEVKKLESEYSSVFSSADKKIEIFKGFVASISLNNYAPHRDVKRSFSTQVVDEIKPTIMALLNENVIEINDEASFVSNILAVAKPNSHNILNSKFDKHVLKGSGENLNRSRLCIDIRNLNKRISHHSPHLLHCPNYRM